MRIAIIGSRERTSPRDREQVFALVETLAQDPSTTLISGGCPVGADKYAEEAAAHYNVPITVFLPICRRCAERRFACHCQAKARWEFVEEFYARNREIVKACDIIYGQTSASINPALGFVVTPGYNVSKGGTGYTLNYARKLKKPVYILTALGQIRPVPPK